jgi:hypothetical protein
MFGQHDSRSGWIQVAAQRECVWSLAAVAYY